MLKYKLKQEEAAKAKEGKDVEDAPGTREDDDEPESPDKRPNSAESGDSPGMRKDNSNGD